MALMNAAELASIIDLALLSPLVWRPDVQGMARRMSSLPFAALCVPPSLVAYAARLLRGSGVGVCTVIGFPLGYEDPRLKAEGARRAVEDGAAELDMVMNQGAFHAGEYSLVEDEIAAVVRAGGGVPVKVIIECSRLGREEKLRALEIVVSAGAGFVKTSTGFGPGGATVEDVRLLSRAARGRVGVKAAGGIRTAGEALAMVEAGATRIGTSRGVEIVEALQRGVG